MGALEEATIKAIKQQTLARLARMEILRLPPYWVYKNPDWGDSAKLY